MQHIRQSRPDSGIVFQVKIRIVPFSLGSGGVGRNVKRFRGGLVFKAHRLVYHSTLGLGVIKKKKQTAPRAASARPRRATPPQPPAPCRTPRASAIVPLPLGANVYGATSPRTGLPPSAPCRTPRSSAMVQLVFTCILGRVKEFSKSRKRRRIEEGSYLRLDIDVCITQL